MKLKTIDYDLTVCKVKELSDIDLDRHFYFIGKTDEELSLVCITENAPQNTIERDDGWRGFRIEGILDFSMVGILSKISSLMAENGIGIFAVSTYNTDYVLIKKENFESALEILSNAGYTIL